MIMVTALLVLLVIIASAFLTRTQASRLISSAQQSTQSRQQRIEPIMEAVVHEVAGALFPKPIDVDDPALRSGPLAPPNPAGYGYPRVASSSYPRVDPTIGNDPAVRAMVRYGVDSLDLIDVLDGPTSGFMSPDGIPDGYNFAPFHVYPWTNWPDLFASDAVLDDSHPVRLFESNPWGNPGFGDARWLRSTEPVRFYDRPALGWTFGQSPSTELGQPYFSHWAHLSNPSTPNNGWILIPDIRDCVAGANWFNTLNNRHNTERNGLFIPWEQWLPGVQPDSAFFVTGQTNGVGSSAATIQLANRFNDVANAWFNILPSGEPFGYLSRVGQSPPYAGTTTGIAPGPMPNFLRLPHFGPKRDEFTLGTARQIVSSRLCDTDGDGFTDSYWFMPPTSVDRAVRYVVGVSVVDNSAMVNVNTATVFDRTQTSGLVPGDVALMSRRDATGQPPGGTLASNEFNPLRAGLFGQYARLSGDGSGSPNNDALNLYPPLDVDLWRDQFGVSVDTDEGKLVAHGAADQPTFVRELGLVYPPQDPDDTPSIPGIDALLLSPIDRLRHYKAFLNGGRVDSYVLADGTAVAPNQRTNSRINFFAIPDEIELRRYAGNNDPTLSRLERALDPAAAAERDEAGTVVSGSGRDLLRASPSRSESFEGFEGAGSALGVGKLNAVQLLHDSRRHLTTYNGARNEMMPPWLWFNPVTNPDAEGLVLGVPATGPDPFRQVDGGDVDGDGLPGTEFDWDAARSRFLQVNRKLDLRRPIEEPEFGVGGVLANWPDMLASKQQFVQDVYYRLARSMLDPFDPNRGVSYLGRDDDAAKATRRMAASLAANIECWRDGRVNIGPDSAAVGGGTGQPEQITRLVDEPFHFNDAPYIEEENNLKFLGNEKHPVIMEAFFMVVYPKANFQEYARWLLTPASGSNLSAAAREKLRELATLAAAQDPYQAPNGLPATGQSFVLGGVDGQPGLSWNPRVVVAVQLANPWNEPIDLSEFRLVVAGKPYWFAPSRLPSGGVDWDSESQVVSNGTDWGYGTNPILGPTTPGQPRSVIVFAMPKSVGGNASPPTDSSAAGTLPNLGPLVAFAPFEPRFRTKMIDFLDLTHPWLDRGYGDRTEGWPYARRLMQELDEAVTAAGGNVADARDPFPRPMSGFPSTRNGERVCDLFEDPLTAYPDCLVMNAGQGEIAPTQGGLPVTVDLYRQFVQNPTRSFVELERRIRPRTSRLNADADWIVIDRLDNPIDTHSSAPENFADRVSRLLVAQSGVTAFLPPAPAAGLQGTGTNQPFFMSMLALPAGADCYGGWVRAVRPWAWDIDGSSTIDANERSPYYTLSRVGSIESSMEYPLQGPNLQDCLYESLNATDAAGFAWDTDAEPDGYAGPASELPDGLIRTSRLNRPLQEGAEHPQSRGKPTAFSCQTVMRLASPAYQRLSVGFQYDAPPTSSLVQISDADKAVPDVDRWSIRPVRPETPDDERDGVVGGEDGVPDVYQYPAPLNFPLQMVQRDGDFESLAEVLQVQVWGPVWDRDVGGTKFTLGELLALTPRDVEGNAELAGWMISPEAAPLVANDSDPFTSWDLLRVGGSPNRLSFPFDPSKREREDQTQLDIRFNRPSLPNIASADYFPFNPRLPAGVSLLDAFTIDGPGSVPFGNAVAAEDRSPRLARGFEGALTPGLININTAPVEVMRSLPHMGSLAYNEAHPRRDAVGSNESDDLSGFGSGQNSFPFSLAENMAIRGPRVRVPEAIATYRESRPMGGSSIPASGFAEYWDRGRFDDDEVDPQFGFYPGMRRGQGIMSIGELALMHREAGSDPGTTTPLSYRRSWSVNYAGRDPFAAIQGDSFLGWGSLRSDGLDRLDAKLSTDRLPTVLQYDFGPDSLPDSSRDYAFPQFPEPFVAQADHAAGDAEETNLLLTGIANLVTTRSDVFTVYLRIRAFTQNPVTGRWDATDRENVIEDTRYVMLVDRSQVNRPGDAPRILYVERIDD